MTQDIVRTILLVCSSHADLGETGNPTGFWMEELTAPYYAFKDAGFQVMIASPKGGQPPVDPGSMMKDMQGPSVVRFVADNEAKALLAASKPLDELTSMQAFDSIFLVGGHGTMWDFPVNPKLGQLLVEAVASSKIIGAVCHGVAGLLADGAPAVLEGKSVAGFTNVEEAAVGLTDIVPFLLETRLSQSGFNHQSGAMFQPYVVTDGQLVTGQNPASSREVADAMIIALAEA